MLESQALRRNHDGKDRRHPFGKAVARRDCGDGDDFTRDGDGDGQGDIGIYALSFRKLWITGIEIARP